MDNSKNKSVRILILFFAACFVFAACEEDSFDNETFDSFELRILKVSEGDRTLVDGDGGVAAFGLELEVVFSAAVDTDAISSALTLSNSGTYTASFDDTNSIMTLVVTTLQYETEYALSLLEGAYGADGEALSSDFSLSFTTSPFIIPSVALSASSNSILEGELVTITATLSEETTEDVLVTLAYGGSAVLDTDFTASDVEITIPAQQLSASIDLSVIDDIDVEGEENIILEVGNLVNGQEASDQMITIAIVDNDVATDLELKGVLALSWTTSGTNGGKAIHLKAKEDIADLSVYSIGVANNGGGTDGIEYTFPAVSASAGDDILLAREDATLSTYFGACASEFEMIIQSDAMTQNGDDAIELFSAGSIIETYGDADVDGTGQGWDYAGSWGYKLGNTWIYGGVDCAESSTTTQDSDCTYPICGSALRIKGILSIEADFDGDGGTDRVRAFHYEVMKDISNLSIYAYEIYANGGTDVFRTAALPAESAAEGSQIIHLRDADETNFATYFGACANNFDAVYLDGDITSNGNDAIALIENGVRIDEYGVIGVDGTGQPWDYDGSWAYKEFGDTYTYAGASCADGFTSNASADCSYILCE